MKRRTFTQTLALGLGGLPLHGALAQITPQEDPIELCQGAYFTPAQAQAFLAKVKCKSLSDWQIRRQQILYQLKAGMGWNPSLLTDRKNYRKFQTQELDMGTYRIQHHLIESIPGYFICANLYLPKTIGSQNIPAVLCPHGHDGESMGRFREQTQQRCASMARMGMAALAIDMLGYGDSKQADHKHPKALLLHTLNGHRALDFLLDLPYVDSKRLGMSGESGGGTQTFILAALDPRIQCVVPCVMVSAHFFGGCTCESGLPIHKKGNFQTNNVEIAGLMAPKPMHLISDGKDWTSLNPSVEYPFLRDIYQLYGQEGGIGHTHLPEEGHDYGPSKRAAAHRFFAQVFGIDPLLDESPNRVLSPSELSVFQNGFTLPSKHLKGNEALLQALGK